MALLAAPEDNGIGDVVRRMIGDFTSETFKAWHKATLGTDCGCATRQREWNDRYPLR